MKKKIFLIGIIIISILFTSCTNKSNKKPMKIEQKEKAPKNLVAVMEGIDKVLVSMDKIEEIFKLSNSEFEVMKTKKENNDKKSKKEESENKNENIPTKDEELIKKWETIDKSIEKIHKDWNSFEVESMKKKISIEKGKDFKDNLNLLTESIENRKIQEIIDSGSKSMFQLAYFFDIYKDDIRGDLLRIKYAAYQGYLKFQNGNAEDAEKLLADAEEHITRIRQKLDKEKVKTLDQLSLSIMDMKQSLKNSSKKLLEIKRDLILENVNSLQK